MPSPELFAQTPARGAGETKEKKEKTEAELLTEARARADLLISEMRAVKNDPSFSGPEKRRKMDVLLDKLKKAQEIRRGADIEFIPDFNGQIEAQRESQIKSGLLKAIQSGEQGIEAIDKNEYPFPTAEAIAETLAENKEFYEKKAEQGFTRLQITPVIPLAGFIKAAERELKKRPEFLKDKNGQIQTNPIWRWEEGYELETGQGLDETGELVYFPKELKSDDHGGITKIELLKKTLETKTPGYIIELKQANPLLPRKNKAETKGGRKNIEAGKTPKEYLKDMAAEQEKENSAYRGETFVTPDSRIQEFIQELQAGRIIGDWQNPDDSSCFCLGAYFKNFGYAPHLNWNRGGQQFNLSGDGPDDSDLSYGSSASAMVGLELA